MTTNTTTISSETPELSRVWEAIDSPIYRVIDENSVNVADAMIRRLSDDLFLYVDSDDGYEITDNIDGMYLIADDDFVPRGYTCNGEVIDL